MKKNPTIVANGNTYEITDSSDVKTLFIDQSGFEISSQVAELIVDSIDAEFDYSSRIEQNILRCYVYFTPIEAVNMGYVENSKLEVENWDQEKTMVGNNELCIVYERAC